MSWFYEIRGEDNRLVEVRSGFATEQAAREAGERAKRMIDCVCYPNLETLTLLTRAGTLQSRAAEPEVKFKYPWQQLVRDAFLEPDSTKVLYKIATAERALGARLCGVTVPGSLEHLAIGEALLALGRLLSQFESKATSGECQDDSTPDESDESEEETA